MLIGKILLKRYQVIEKIGGGAFGHTYKAIDTAFPGQPHHVVKHLCPHNNEPENIAIAKRLFKKEAEVLSTLGEHDQIPRLFAYFEEDGQFYLVQELIEGHNLTQEFQSGKRWSEIETVTFLQELLGILSVVHQQNTVHRDLKPANIMRRQKDGKLVLIDFGAVKEILNVSQTLLSIGIGTSSYMPPEQAQGRPGKYSDIYAVGMLGIQALTGLLSRELPQDSEQLEQMWNNLQIKINPQLKYVLGRMVSYQYQQRFADANEALSALIPTEVDASKENETSKAKLPFILLGIVALVGAGITGFKLLTQPNYSQLETSLQSQQWQQADEETDKIILKIAGKKSALDAESAQSFPCKALEKIDTLWQENSDGKFGFVPQKKVYLETGNDFQDYVDSTYEAFGNKVGWRIFGTWKRYEDLNFDKIDTEITPPGYLPSPGKVAANKQDLRIREREMLLSRFNTCQ